MNILIASTPAMDHLNPLLAIMRILVAEDHEITLDGQRLSRPRPHRKDRIEIRFASDGGRFRSAGLSVSGSQAEGHSARTRTVPSFYRADP